MFKPRFADRRLQQGVAGLLAPLMLLLPPAAGAAGARAAGDAIQLRLDSQVTITPWGGGRASAGLGLGRATPGLAPPASGPGVLAVDTGPDADGLVAPPAPTADAPGGEPVAPTVTGPGFWQRALAAIVFEFNRLELGPAALDETVALDDAASAPMRLPTATAGEVMEALSGPLQGVVKSFAGEGLGDETIRWRMLYDRPSRLSRGGDWRGEGEADRLFDDDGTLEPGRALGVQMQMSW